jgi:thioredoxin-like negative regulator of GroEL
MKRMNGVVSVLELAQKLKSPTPQLLCFVAQWCGDCHYLKPGFSELELRFANQVGFWSVDIDDHPALAQEYEVTGIPSFVLVHAGREVYRLVNERRKSKEEVRQFIEKGLSLIH